MVGPEILGDVPRQRPQNGGEDPENPARRRYQAVDFERRARRLQCVQIIENHQLLGALLRAAHHHFGAEVVAIALQEMLVASELPDEQQPHGLEEEDLDKEVHVRGMHTQITTLHTNSTSNRP